MRAEVQRYYGETLQSTADLKTTACCTTDPISAEVKAILADIHDEVVTRYYGCGLVLPELLAGSRVLDLGCGAGRDVYVLSRMVGEQGRVVGVDMTPEQLAVARRHQQYHADRFGYSASNVEFLDGDIEQLERTGLADNTFDLIVSNCVINLATDKRAVLDQAWRLLVAGGELYFADIYADRRIPEDLRADPVLYGECLSGAMYWRDFLETARAAGFTDPRLVESRPVDVSEPKLAKKLGDIRFVSATYRLFKVGGLEAGSEDYGLSVIYRGTVPGHAEQLSLDEQHCFKAGEEVAVSGNSFRLLAASRFAPHFEFDGDFETHHGGFSERAQASPSFASGPSSAASCC